MFFYNFCDGNLRETNACNALFAGIVEVNDLVQGGATSLFGQVWENSGKNPAHPQKFACSYAYCMFWTTKTG